MSYNLKKIVRFEKDEKAACINQGQYGFDWKNGQIDILGARMITVPEIRNQFEICPQVAHTYVLSDFEDTDGVRKYIDLDEYRQYAKKHKEDAMLHVLYCLGITRYVKRTNSSLTFDLDNETKTGVEADSPIKEVFYNGIKIPLNWIKAKFSGKKQFKLDIEAEKTKYVEKGFSGEYKETDFQEARIWANRYGLYKDMHTLIEERNPTKSRKYDFSFEHVDLSLEVNAAFAAASSLKALECISLSKTFNLSASCKFNTSSDVICWFKPIETKEDEAEWYDYKTRCMNENLNVNKSPVTQQQNDNLSK